MPTASFSLALLPRWHHATCSAQITAASPGLKSVELLSSQPYGLHACVQLRSSTLGRERQAVQSKIQSLQQQLSETQDAAVVASQSSPQALLEKVGGCCYVASPATNAPTVDRLVAFAALKPPKPLACLQIHFGPQHCTLQFLIVLQALSSEHRLLLPMLQSEQLEILTACVGWRLEQLRRGDGNAELVLRLADRFRLQLCISNGTATGKVSLAAGAAMQA